jgi:RNA polymerase sigma factor (sigma-70 family)
MSDPKVKPELVEEAYRRHHADIESYLLRRLGDRDEAEELTQAVFVEAVERLPRLPSPPDSVLAWLYTVAHRRFVDEIRRRTRRRRRAHLLYREETVEENGYGQQVVRALTSALNDVPDEQRQIVVARLFDDCPFGEIAAELGISEAAAKMRFTRALSTIRDRLAREGFAP